MALPDNPADSTGGDIARTSRENPIPVCHSSLNLPIGNVERVETPAFSDFHKIPRLNTSHVSLPMTCRRESVAISQHGNDGLVRDQPAQEAQDDSGQALRPPTRRAEDAYRGPSRIWNIFHYRDSRTPSSEGSDTDSSTSTGRFSSHPSTSPAGSLTSPTQHPPQNQESAFIVYSPPPTPNQEDSSVFRPPPQERENGNPAPPSQPSRVSRFREEFDLDTVPNTPLPPYASRFIEEFDLRMPGTPAPTYVEFPRFPLDEEEDTNSNDVRGQYAGIQPPRPRRRCAGECNCFLCLNERAMGRPGVMYPAAGRDPAGIADDEGGEKKKKRFCCVSKVWRWFGKRKEKKGDRDDAWTGVWEDSWTDVWEDDEDVEDDPWENDRNWI